MDNLKTHSEQSKQPHGQQANGLPLDVPTGQALDTHMIEQQSTNQTPLWFSLEQHRLQLDQVRQLYNEQVRVSLQQEISLQNATLSNLLTTDALIQKVEEVASLRMELQRNQEDRETLRHACDQLLQRVVIVYETNEALIRMCAPLQQETNSHVSGPGDKASSLVRTTAETTKIERTCMVCNSGGACMMLLPCKHLCTCKPCGVHLTACPICGVVKGDAVETQFI
ncbi:hypothetical protein PAHAL_2G097400 [Panicum hallii]|uniref:RING-type domain-containing protein n=1 Tax=Panicum hallii TaxID=206008 RepID=A0A2S3GX54_9POAL|nr:hypothetical protein PAHAL_2G097400 [Panicum hallii]